MRSKLSSTYHRHGAYVAVVERGGGASPKTVIKVWREAGGKTIHVATFRTAVAPETLLVLAGDSESMASLVINSLKPTVRPSGPHVEVTLKVQDWVNLLDTVNHQSTSKS